MKYIIKCKRGFMLLLYNKIYLSQVLALLFFQINTLPYTLLLLLLMRS